MRRSKIVCTIGPACSQADSLKALFDAGMDVARLNFSHGTHDEHAAVIERLRSIADRSDRPIAILQDLCGPKVRLGEMPNPVELMRGQRITLGKSRSLRDDKSQQVVPLDVPELIEAVKPGDRLLADDGCIELRVESKQRDSIEVVVKAAGTLSSRKGIAAPGVHLDIPAVTDKDRDDLKFGLGHGVDWVAASYVRCADDIGPLRAVMKKAGVWRPVIAKIENQAAVRSIEEILSVVEGIMVARGDLGVEIPIDEVPMVQKRIIRLCNRAGKPVITATQMLESMIHSPRPTRAEVTDVANAILDGSDAVMLSGETAVGKYALEAVRMMAKVAERADCSIPDRALFGQRGEKADFTESVAQATVEIARSIGAKAIICATTSGNSARLVAKYRPDTQILGVTPDPETYRRMALIWGVRPLLIDPVADTDEMMEKTLSVALSKKLVRKGDRVILTAGIPIGVPGNTNMLKVHVI